MVVRSITHSLVEQLSAAGELGENVPRLQAAAEWFLEQGDLAHLRGRLVQSQLGGEVVERGLPVEWQSARQALARAYDWIGGDAFNVLYDTLIWEIELRGPNRRALFRAALHALDRALRANAESPPGT